MRRIIASIIGTAVLVITAHGGADACSRVLWNTKDLGVFAARSMDWHVIFDPQIMIYPRGISVDGGLDRNAAKWTSQFGSVVINGTNFDNAAIDGMNEKGLTAHVLYLDATKYEKRDARLGVSYLNTLRYLLDNSATVVEALNSLTRIQVIPVPIHGNIFGAHLAIEDSSGDSAIIEFINRKMVVHHGRRYVVLTNDPPYDVAIKELKNYQPFGGTMALPGGIEPIDRFVRAEYFLKYLPQPKDHAQAVAFMFQVIHNVAVPFGAPYGNGGVYPTWWLSAADLTDKVYYFSMTDSPNVIWVDVSKLNFSNDQPVMSLDPKNPALVGDVSRGFQPLASK
jgi:penicillin V acylase-like amidase (Ntn superfamily)